MFLCFCKCYRIKVNVVYLFVVYNIKENYDVFMYFIFLFVLDKILKMFLNIGSC